MEKITRIGVYGVATENNKILLITQKKGPFVNKYDFPGGGIEFGETPEETLQREFVEEVNMTFASQKLHENITATTHVPSHNGKEPFTFFQIGMIYRVCDLKPLKNTAQSELPFHWVDIKSLKQEYCSALLWKYINIKYFK
jgi:mutator protein MutT